MPIDCNHSTISVPMSHIILCRYRNTKKKLYELKLQPQKSRGHARNTNKQFRNLSNVTDLFCQLVLSLHCSDPLHQLFQMSVDTFHGNDFEKWVSHFRY